MKIIKGNFKFMEGIRATAINFGVSEHYVRQLALSGKVNAVRVGGGRILINQQSVAEYFNNSILADEKKKHTTIADF